MRSITFGLFVLLLSVVQAWAQQTQLESQTAILPPALKEAQAVSLVTQALSAAGSERLISTIADYTATGNVTYYLDVDRQVQGGVTIRGKGLNQFRIDANLPSGVRSEATNGLTTIRTDSGSVRQLHTQPSVAPARLAMPNLHLNAALKSRGLTLTYKGIIDVDNRPTHDIEVQRILPGTSVQHGEMNAYLTVDYFVDLATLQIVMMQDILPTRRVRQFRYSDFRLVNGVLVPFAISETINAQQIWLVNLNGIIFNSSLQDSDFQL